MNIITLSAETVLLLILGICAYSDIKSRTIPLTLIAGALICGIGYQIAVRQMGFLEIIAGCMVGVAIIAVAFFSGQKIGYGDGMLFIATGSFLGIGGNIWLLVFSLAVSMIVGIAHLLINKLNRKTAIPFAPCILCGYLGLLAIG